MYVTNIHTYVCIYVSMYVLNTSLFICVAITVRFNQSAYKVAKEDVMIQLFLVLSTPSSFNETVQFIANVGNDNFLSGMTCKYVMCKCNMYFNIKGAVMFSIGSTVASESLHIFIFEGNILINGTTLDHGNMFNISITSITNGHNVGTPAVATVTIIDTTSKYIN